MLHRFYLSLSLTSIREIFKSLLIVTIVLITFGQLARFPTSRPDFNILAIDVVVICTSGLYQYLKFISLNPIQSSSWVHVTRNVFISITGIAWLLHPVWFTNLGTLPALLYLLRLWMYLFIPEIVIFALIKVKDVYEIIKALLFTFLIIVIAGLIQYIWIPDFHFLQFWGWDNHLYRLASTLLDPGFAGIILALGIILLFPLLTYNLTKRSILLFIFTIIGILSLALTFSRASYVAFIAAILAWYLSTRKIIPIIGLIIALIISIQLAPKPAGEGVNLARTSTINFRLTNWTNSWNIFINNQLWGIGYNRYRYVQHELGILDNSNWQESHSASGTDSSALFLLATTGVIGTITFIIFVTITTASIFSVNKTMIKRRNSSAVDIIYNHLPHITLASLITIFIHGMFHNTWFYPFTLCWIMILIGTTITVGKTRLE